MNSLPLQQRAVYRLPATELRDYNRFLKGRDPGDLKNWNLALEKVLHGGDTIKIQSSPWEWQKFLSTTHLL